MDHAKSAEMNTPEVVIWFFPLAPRIKEVIHQHSKEEGECRTYYAT